MPWCREEVSLSADLYGREPDMTPNPRGRTTWEAHDLHPEGLTSECWGPTVTSVISQREE